MLNNTDMNSLVNDLFNAGSPTGAPKLATITVTFDPNAETVRHTVKVQTDMAPSDYSKAAAVLMSASAKLTAQDTDVDEEELGQAMAKAAVTVLMKKFFDHVSKGVMF